MGSLQDRFANHAWMHTELAVRPLICLPHIGRYKVVGNVFGLSSNVSMVINVVNLTSIGRDPPSLWLEQEQLHIQ